MAHNESYQTRVVTNQGTRTPTTGIGTAPATRKTTQAATRKRRAGGKMVLFGAISASAYMFLFANETLVTQTFTLGGWHAVYPVMTAFFFSFVHGAFASNLLSFIGLEAKKA